MIKSRILVVFLAVGVLAGCTLPGQISLTGFDKVDIS